MKYPQLVSMPSAVSDWLEEQLEARGIDAVVYTRYVLSLLYRDPVDIICPDQDLHVTHPNKDVRRAGGGRKRFCRSSDYSHWGHVDADRLKRSAAVECLKSASDQKCGIESLVDELCIKLKEVQREGSSASEETSEESRPAKETSKAVRIPKKLSERDSARRYYAAFPALARTPSSTIAPSPKLVHLIPKWLGSPKRRVAVKKPQRAAVSLGDKLHASCKQDVEMKTRSTGKHRFNYFARTNYAGSGCAAVGKKEYENREVAHHQTRSGGTGESAAMSSGRKNSAPQQVARPDDEQRDEAMYDDLPVLGDIRDLLDSPASPTAMMPIELMNLANMTGTGSNKFLQCGTNIISSIWSTSEDNLHPVDLVDHKFSNIRIDHGMWSSEPHAFFGGDWGYKVEERWSDGYDQESLVAKSLLKLNHHREGSCFAEVQPRSRFAARPSQVPVVNTRTDDYGTAAESAAAKDDLLHSARSHFKPINEKAEAKAKEYADGTTFAILANLDEVTFQRSESGTMFLEESGCNKRYLEYAKDSAGTPNSLRLKFNVNQNDKGCQTDAADLDVSLSRLAFTLSDYDVYSDDIDVYYAGGEEQLSDSELSEQRPDSMMAELFGKEHKCEQCSSPWSQSQQLGGGSSTNIWNGEICMTCLRVSDSSDGATFKVTPLEERQQLREDIQEDGEQLLSDLSSLQKSYMEEDLPVAEESCDINALILTQPRNNNDGDDLGNVHGNCGEWRGLQIKHSSGVPIHSASFSFATRLQQDCLLKMATIPTLRSVTL